jgi:hypothetical protein
MPVLIIGATEREKIARVIAYAKAHPISLDKIMQVAVLDDKPVMELKDRKTEFIPSSSAHVIFPGGFRAAFSHEYQPPGLCSHLSISLFDHARKGVMPSPEAVAMIAQEFNVPFPPDKTWTEEFAPGEYAVNLVSLLAAHPHAGPLLQEREDK